MMSSIQPVTLERHGTRRWRRATSYAFAAGHSVAPIMGAELARAAMAMPIAWVPDADAYVPVAVLGMEPGQCLYLASDGSWTVSYVPAALRSFPFLLAPTQDGKRILCIDEESGLAPDGGDGEPFFESGGALAAGLQGVFKFLSDVENQRLPTQAASAALQKHGLLVPLEIDLQLQAGIRKVQGLFRVDAAALDALADEAFIELRRSGALVLAYAQVFSMQNLPSLIALAQARERKLLAEAAMTKGGELDLSFLQGQGDTLRFS